MSNGKSLQPTKYGKHRYNITTPMNFDVALKYAGALMAIAGADGELAEKEFQWYVEEAELTFVESAEFIEELRKFDWKNANIEELLSGIRFDFPVNFRRVMLYHAIKMSRADGVYQEKAAVSKAAEILGIDRSTVVSLESVAEVEDATERMRLAIFETDV